MTSKEATRIAEALERIVAILEVHFLTAVEREEIDQRREDAQYKASESAIAAEAVWRKATFR